MDEVENTGVTEEIAAPETETSQDVAPKEQPQVDDRQDRNWRELRRAKDELERKAKMQEELLGRLLAQQQVHQQPASLPEEDIISQLSQQEYVEGAKVAKALQKQEEKWNQRVKQIEEKYEQNNRNSLFNDLKARYPDFSDLVNPETLAILETEEPELAQTIADNKDPYKVAVQSYKYIKALGIADKVPGTRRVKEVEEKLEKKAPPVASDKRPMAQAFALPKTREEQKRLYNEMMGFANLSGGSY